MADENNGASRGWFARIKAKRLIGPVTVGTLIALLFWVGQGFDFVKGFREGFSAGSSRPPTCAEQDVSVGISQATKVGKDCKPTNAETVTR